MTRLGVPGLMLWAILISALFVGYATAEVDPQRLAGGYLALAETYFEAGDYTEARELVQKAIETDPTVQAQATALLRLLLASEQEASVSEQRDTAELAARRDRLLLDEADRLVKEGRYEDAAKLIREKLGTLAESVLKSAEESLQGAHPNWWLSKWAALFQHGWIGDGLILLLVFAAIYLLLRVVRRLYLAARRRHWLVALVDDTTEWGVGDLLLANLERWSALEIPASAGLLKLERPAIQAIPAFEKQRPQVDLSSAVEALPAVGGVTPAALAKALAVLPGWLKRGRAVINGSAAATDGGIVMRLTARDPDGRFFTVSGRAGKTMESCTAVAEEVTFKMYYAIANEVSVAKSEAADRLRQGLKQLRRYLSTGEAAALKSASETFAAVREENPALEEAYLYEGVALDLLEDHDEAQERFFHLVANARSDALRIRASYNLAISRFRKYRPEELEEAVRQLETLIGNVVIQKYEGKLEGVVPHMSPIEALALAARANAIAHRPIFWQVLALGREKSEDPHEVLQRKVEAWKTVQHWLVQVEQLTQNLEKLYHEVRWRTEEGWDEVTCRQLKWAIENARGNVHLNCAYSFLREPHLPGAGEPELREAYLQKALSSFQECRMLLRPGVETLSNLATTLLFLGQTTKARKYAEEVIKLNADYEYGYYRLAQAWELDNEPDEVRKTLKRLERPPRIMGFAKMFEKYGVKPKAA